MPEERDVCFNSRTRARIVLRERGALAVKKWWILSGLRTK